ncbi:hypothetical protein J2Y71_002379 [Bacillus pumilus]|nr:hypothetical protein [Bacillus pumilus]MDF9785144.1 hypothetical protein [Bacillus pumilus]MDR6747580.1 hypothetical protein [Bacillus pumilus]
MKSFQSSFVFGIDHDQIVREKLMRSQRLPLNIQLDAGHA